MAKLEILKVNSAASAKRTSKVSNGMKSYFEKAQLPQQLNVDADEFFPQQVEINTLPNTNVYNQNQTQFHITPPINDYGYHEQEMDRDLERRDDVVGIMTKQNEITAMLLQQQSLSLLPKREISCYNGHPLKYHLFIKAFENGVEKNTTNSCDRLYFLETTYNGSCSGAGEKLSTHAPRSRIC